MPAIIAGKFLNKPTFITFHEVWGQLWKRLPFISSFEKYAFYYFEKLILNLPFFRFIAVSEFTKSSLIDHGISEDKIIRIYNGIEYPPLKDRQKDLTQEFTYTYFGRLGISKGLDLLLPAAFNFSKEYPKSKLKLIIPKQPKKMYNQILKEIASYNLDNHIELHHNLSQSILDKELLNSSCIVIPSYSEGFCYAAAETVALQIPIISSHLGALKEVVSGKYVQMNDQSSKSLFIALEKALNNNWTEKPIRYFHLDDSVRQYEKMYKSTFVELQR